MFSNRIFKQINKNLVSITKRYTGKDVAIIGVPFSGGQPKPGVEYGPKCLRDGGIKKTIENLGRQVYDYGDIEIPEYSVQNPDISVFDNGVRLKNARTCGKVSQNLSNLVEEALKDDKICVTLGGDHSIATGTLIGHQRVNKDVCVVWVDAHNDLNTWRTSLSGNLHGMPLSFVLKGFADAHKVPGYAWTSPCIDPKNLVYIGIRETDPEEFVMTRNLGIPMFSMHDIDRYGIAEVMDRAMSLINPNRDKPIHVSFDIDSIDPMYSPSTGTPVYGGLSLREGLYIGEYISQLGLLQGLDLVEVNPMLGKTQRDPELTVDTAICLVEACLGRHRSGLNTRNEDDLVCKENSQKKK